MGEEYMELSEEDIQIYKSQKPIVQAMWAVLGYAFVGFISLAYGITLQIYNLKKYESFEEIKQIIYNDKFQFIYFMFILLTILLNLIFCHAHASLNVHGSGTDKILYSKLGHWLETIIAVVMIYFFFWCIQCTGIGIKALAIMALVCIPWCMSTILYRTYLKGCKHKGLNNWFRVKYKLIIPTILLVATNIYTGASFVQIWMGKTEYTLFYLFLPGFILIYVLIEWRYNRKLGEGKKGALDTWFPFIFYAFLSIYGVVILYGNRYLEIADYYVPFRTLFLGCCVAVYLAVFEGWFLLTKEESVTIEKWINRIVTYTPMVVFALFPIQQFQLVYFVSFMAGHCVAWLYWEFVVMEKQNGNPKISIVRAILGTITLAALIMDKVYYLSVPVYIGRIINVKQLLNLNRITVGFQIVSAVIALAMEFRLYPDMVKKQNNILLRIGLYIILALVLAIVYPTINKIEIERVLLSIVGCFIFTFFECIGIHRRRIKNIP